MSRADGAAVDIVQVKHLATPADLRARAERLGVELPVDDAVEVGGPLARLEINIALEVFLRRVRSPRLVVDPPPYRHNQVFRGPRHLWVDFASID